MTKSLKDWWSDYQMKKNKASKYMGIYNALSSQEGWRGGETLLKKVEKWQKKADDALNGKPESTAKMPQGTLETVGDKLN